ncbi:hypothetical protein [Nocardioides flavescens]|uniref:Uncharacterized protein n=1 Tax=Nocardioides flavescens TaxID=2691959 RepID=A0A6L7EQG6_9ACTN|nr:hypothetical protein [Nocardioides flavescens]MXG88840.1 hypothetical protein [Nocardioides flavescens]
MTVVILIVLAAVALFALAWWSSGRRSPSARGPMASRDAADAEARAMGQYRPPPGPGPLGGPGGT